jgi:hypothetical protein
MSASMDAVAHPTPSLRLETLELPSRANYLTILLSYCSMEIIGQFRYIQRDIQRIHECLSLAGIGNVEIGER